MSEEVEVLAIIRKLFKPTKLIIPSLRFSNTSSFDYFPYF